MFIEFLQLTISLNQHTLTPSFGPEDGGNIVRIRGRNLAFLKDQVKVARAVLMRSAST